MGKRLSQLESIANVDKEHYLLIDGEDLLQSKKAKLKDINLSSFKNDLDIPTVDIKVDGNFNPNSDNPQSGKAVAEALAVAKDYTNAKIDQTYAPTSENAQSGIAVAQAIDTFFTDKNMKLIKEITLIEDVGAIDILTKDEGIELRDTFIYCSFLVTEAGSKNIALIKDGGHCYYGYGLNVGNYTEEQVTNGKPRVFGHFIYPIGETGRVLTLGLEGTVDGKVNPVTGWSQGLMMHNSKFTYTYHPDPNIFAEKIDNLNMFLIGRTETNLIKAGSKIWLFGRRVK